jgi:hypothetical protein
VRIPKTIRGYILMMREIECFSPSLCKGYDELPKQDKEYLIIMVAEISNNLNEIKSYKS